MLSIASYNVLADAYIKPAYYPDVLPAALDPARRHPALVARIAALDADVVCLQEVEASLFARLERELTGYFGVHRLKGRGKPDGCAIFARVPLGEPHVLTYADGTGHIALTVRAGDVAITTTHLKWDHPAADPHLGCGQARELVAAGVAGDARAWVVCGDLNATPDSAVLAILRAAGLRDAFAAAPPGTCNANGPARQLDYLLVAGCSAQPRPVRSLADDEPLPALDEPSDHLPVCAVLAP